MQYNGIVGHFWNHSLHKYTGSSLFEQIIDPELTEKTGHKSDAVYCINSQS